MLKGFLSQIMTPRWFAWIKSQPIYKVSLFAQINAYEDQKDLSQPINDTGINKGRLRVGLHEGPRPMKPQNQSVMFIKINKKNWIQWVCIESQVQNMRKMKWQTKCSTIFSSKNIWRTKIQLSPSLRNQSRSQGSQVQPITCWDLSSFSWLIWSIFHRFL